MIETARPFVLDTWGIFAALGGAAMIRLLAGPKWLFAYFTAFMAAILVFMIT